MQKSIQYLRNVIKDGFAPYMQDYEISVEEHKELCLLIDSHLTGEMKLVAYKYLDDALLNQNWYKKHIGKTN